MSRPADADDHAPRRRRQPTPEQSSAPAAPQRGHRPSSDGARDAYSDGQNGADGERRRRQARGAARPPQRLRPPRYEDALAQRTAQREREQRQRQDTFKCGHCRRFIGPLPSGGHHRNHCPFCLYSRHVDDDRSGDRASACGALMAPIGAFQRPNGEHVLVHRCCGCGFERFNRIAADDDFDFVLALPVLPPRSARPAAPDAAPQS